MSDILPSRLSLSAIEVSDSQLDKTERAIADQLLAMARLEAAREGAVFHPGGDAHAIDFGEAAVFYGSAGYAELAKLDSARFSAPSVPAFYEKLQHYLQTVGQRAGVAKTPRAHEPAVQLEELATYDPAAARAHMATIWKWDTVSVKHVEALVGAARSLGLPVAVEDSLVDKMQEALMEGGVFEQYARRILPSLTPTQQATCFDALYEFAKKRFVLKSNYTWPEIPRTDRQKQVGQRLLEYYLQGLWLADADEFGIVHDGEGGGHVRFFVHSVWSSREILDLAPIVVALREPTVESRLRALWILDAEVAGQLTPDLLALLKRATDTTERIALMRALAQGGNSVALESLFLFTTDVDPKVREEAKISWERIVRTTAERLRPIHEDAVVNLHAPGARPSFAEVALTLARFAQSDSVAETAQWMCDALSYHPHWMIRLQAVQALAKPLLINEYAEIDKYAGLAVDVFVRLALDQNPHVRAAAIAGLSKMVESDALSEWAMMGVRRLLKDHHSKMYAGERQDIVSWSLARLHLGLIRKGDCSQLPRVMDAIADGVPGLAQHVISEVQRACEPLPQPQQQDLMDAASHILQATLDAHHAADNPQSSAVLLSKCNAPYLVEFLGSQGQAAVEALPLLLGLRTAVEATAALQGIDLHPFMRNMPACDLLHLSSAVDAAIQKLQGGSHGQ